MFKLLHRDDDKQDEFKDNYLINGNFSRNRKL